MFFFSVSSLSLVCVIIFANTFRGDVLCDTGLPCLLVLLFSFSCCTIVLEVYFLKHIRRPSEFVCVNEKTRTQINGPRAWFYARLKPL